MDATYQFEIVVLENRWLIIACTTIYLVYWLLLKSLILLWISLNVWLYRILGGLNLLFIAVNSWMLDFWEKVLYASLWKGLFASINFKIFLDVPFVLAWYLAEFRTHHSLFAVPGSQSHLVWKLFFDWQFFLNWTPSEHAAIKFLDRSMILNYSSLADVHHARVAVEFGVSIDCRRTWIQDFFVYFCIKKLAVR